MDTKDRKTNKGKGISRREFLKTTAMATAGAVASVGLMETASPKIAEAQSSSGTINVVTSQDANSYDPHSWISEDGRIIGSHIFEALVDRDFKPMLATSWENLDKLTWIFHLRQGVQFTNGEAFNASVVKFNVERYMDPKTNAIYRALLEPLDSVEIVDQNNVKIKTKTPYSILINALREIHMMSPKAVKELDKDVVRKPIGTGPFMFREWVPSERTVIDANPDYYGQKAKVKTILWRPVTEASTRIVELKAGTADIISQVPPELAEGISEQGLKILRGRSLWSMLIRLNCGKPPFDNMKVRQAFNYATEKESLIKNVLRGAGYVMSDPLKGLAGENPDIKPYPYDPTMSKKLLAEAGYPNGVDIQLLTPAGRYLKDKEMMEALSYQVKEAGFNVKLNAAEWGMFLKLFKESQAFFVGAEAMFPHQYFARSYDSRSKGFTWMGYDNGEMNRLLDEAGETFDMEKRNAIYRKMAKILFDEAADVWLSVSQQIVGVRDRVKNFIPREDGYINLKSAYVA